MMKKFYIGVDIGGTNIKFGITNSQGVVRFRSNLETRGYLSDRRHLIEALIDSVQGLVHGSGLKCRDIAGIGIGLPGLIDPEKGLVKFLPNIPGWRDVPLKKIFERSTGIPTALENDVNMITLGEWKFGAGQGYQNLICMTLGTGVGGGLILNNQLYRGEGYVAGELGHIPINEKGPVCNCGGFACFERTVGNRYLTQRIATIFRRRDLQIEDDFRLAINGNARAIKFWDETATHIGNALTGIVNVLNPPLIIIGGGIANNERFLFKKIREVIARRAMRVQSRMVKIVRAALGNDAGILGAQVLVKEGL